MRNKFADKIFELGKINKNIAIVVADISPAGSIKKFSKDFSERFINCGVAEQSMIGISAGLALRGFRPFCYTIATFALYRPFEMVRIDLAYHNLPVTIIGMGSGLIYSTLGGTHQSIEDISIACSIPNMNVICPADPFEMEKVVEWCASKSEGPTYVRIGKRGEKNLNTYESDDFLVGKIRYLKKGRSIAIISYGIILQKISTILNIYNKKDFNPSLISCHTIKPLDIEGIKRVLKLYKKIIVIEEHVPHGGLSSRIKEIAFNNQILNSIDCYTLKDKFIKFYGNYDDLLKEHDLDVHKIIKKYI
jgi:transketolase